MLPYMLWDTSPSQGTMHSHTHSDLEAILYFIAMFYVLRRWEKTTEPGRNPLRYTENMVYDMIFLFTVIIFHLLAIQVVL